MAHKRKNPPTIDFLAVSRTDTITEPELTKIIKSAEWHRWNVYLSRVQVYPFMAWEVVSVPREDGWHHYIQDSNYEPSHIIADDLVDAVNQVLATR